jgi:hypothetical protein
MTTGDKAVLDMTDVAELFKCSREKVKRMARSGRAPSVQVWQALVHTPR